jgi:hypothetical protein
VGRSLSELQRYILAEAGKREQVQACEILAGYFGWKSRHESPSEGRLRLNYQENFSRQEIGEEVYRRTMATLRRSIRRLQDRELVERWVGAFGRWFALKITPQGREWLSVNSGVNHPPVNR